MSVRQPSPYVVKCVRPLFQCNVDTIVNELFVLVYCAIMVYCIYVRATEIQ